MGRSDASVDGVAGFEVKTFDLRWRDVDVVRGRQVVVVDGTQETESFGEGFEDALAPDFAAFLGLSLEDGIDEFLPTQISRIFDIELGGVGEEFRDVHAFDFFDLHERFLMNGEV